jgi:predicted ATPase
MPALLEMADECDTLCVLQRHAKGYTKYAAALLQFCASQFEHVRTHVENYQRMEMISFRLGMDSSRISFEHAEIALQNVQL